MGCIQMIKVKIKLDSPSELAELNAAASAVPFDIDLASGWYVADAKSLVGLFGLKLAQPIRMRIYTDQVSAEPFLQRIKKLIIKG